MKKYSTMEDEYDMYNDGNLEEDTDYDDEFTDDDVYDMFNKMIKEDNTPLVTEGPKSLNRKRKAFRIGIKKAKKFENIIKMKNNITPAKNSNRYTNIYKMEKNGIYRKTRTPEFNGWVEFDPDTYENYYKFVKKGGKFDRDIEEYLNERIA